MVRVIIEDSITGKTLNDTTYNLYNFVSATKDEENNIVKILLTTGDIQEKKD